jgi:hypothetical protein
MGLSISRIEKAQEELFARLEEDLSIANGSDYYLNGKDMYYYTMAIRNLEELKKNAVKEEK